VYKEKAYEKFTNLMDELEYKTVKAMFSINQVQEVPQVEINTKDMNFKNVSLQDSTKIKKEATNVKNNTNPLFTNPANAPKNNTKKTKIRV
jgi:preprotein translocase subunit SecA